MVRRDVAPASFHPIFLDARESPPRDFHFQGSAASRSTVICRRCTGLRFGGVIGECAAQADALDHVLERRIGAVGFHRLATGFFCQLENIGGRKVGVAVFARFRRSRTDAASATIASSPVSASVNTRITRAVRHHLAGAQIVRQDEDLRGGPPGPAFLSIILRPR